jgi:hypothetical protein
VGQPKGHLLCEKIQGRTGPKGRILTG